MSTPTVEVSCNSSHLTLNCSTVSGCPVTYWWKRRSQDPSVGNVTFPGAVLYLPDPGQLKCTYTCVTEDCCSSRAVTATLHCNALPRGSRSRWMIVLAMFLLAVAMLGVCALYLRRDAQSLSTDLMACNKSFSLYLGTCENKLHCCRESADVGVQEDDGELTNMTSTSM